MWTLSAILFDVAVDSMIKQLNSVDEKNLINVQHFDAQSVSELHSSWFHRHSLYTTALINST